MRKPDTKNAEVTKRGIKVRGSPESGTQRVVVSNTIRFNLKKKLLVTACLSKTAAILIGLSLYWEPQFDHLVWATGVVTVSELLTLMFAKVE